MSEKQGTKLCKHCKTEIPKGAKICPNCKKKQGGILKWIIIAVVAIGIIGAAGGGGKDSDSKQANNKKDSSNSSMVESTKPESKESEVSKEEPVETDEPEIETISEEEYKELCTEYNYKDVLRNPENYVGEKIKITVKISTVHEAGFTNPTKYYFAYSESDYGWYGDKYAVYDKREEQDPKLLSDDIITVWGEIADPEQTSSLILSSEELFVIDMKYVEIVQE